MWRFAVLSKLPHFYGKISGYVVIYSGKGKNTVFLDFRVKLRLIYR